VIDWLRIIVITLVLGGGTALVGCNTMRGAGEDVEAGGEAVQDAAEDTEDEMED
jgi:predicted small secreted protein